ncbi:MAG: pyruvate:ferredoxin (flavodoxin) oxidoreductase, partial [Clostridia bacterium]|nr:pyruvate:ferredoxin (flavodoxin) oxidoreductase [Clostridia bacterium]
MSRKLKTMDGNTAAATASYAFTEVAAIYPITPSSTMAEVTDQMAASGVKNLFGQTVRVAELQSEAGAAGAVHGSVTAGALTTTYTASQGLLLMIPNMYKIAGEQTPCVLDVSARCVASHALNIFGDHSDVMACRQTGFAMLCSDTVQECMDLGAVAHLSTIKGKVPFLHFFDGFRTSHEIQKIEVWDNEDLAEMVDWDAIADFRRKALNPEHPDQRGSAQSPEIFFQAREACNSAYDDIVEVTEQYMETVNKKIGSDYHLFNYYGAEDAEYVIIAMGSVNGTIQESVDYLNAHGAKVGLVKVHLYRPFSQKYLVKALPKTVKKISVLDRTKEPGSFGEPLFLDVVAALKGTEFDAVPVYAGRFGLGGKDTTPSHIIPIFENMEADAPKTHFTVAIHDDVTNLSLPIAPVLDTVPKGTYSCKFWGLGSDGTVGANKNSIKIIGDHTDKKVQAYFAYDSKKSGGITVSHLRFGDAPINSAYLINSADFVACHNESYIERYDMVQDLKDGGTFLLNCLWKTQEELDEHIPAKVKQFIAKHDIQFYIIDASSIAQEVGLGNRVSTILQSAFFNLTQIIPGDEALQLMKDAATKSFSKKGEDIVRMNHEAIDKGFTAMSKVDVPAAWADATDTPKKPLFEVKDPELKKFMDNVLVPTNDQHGDDIPVSVFSDYVEGKQPLGSAALEKRGVSLFVPEWQPDKCIQCNQCAYVCPHAVIRPVAMTEAEAEAAPASTKLVDLRGVAGYKFGIVVSPYDCSGCGSCANICPAGAKDPANKALVMKPFEAQKTEHFAFEYAQELPEKAEVLEKFKDTTVKGSQFKKPYLEFSGACDGCGETPYAKLVTQLFGNRMYIANATGCSSIWGNSAPSTPFCKDAEGKGPAWSNSLFEDNAEFGLGMFLGYEAVRDILISDAKKLVEEEPDLVIDETLLGW